MSQPNINNWKAVEAEVLSRIQSRQWEPGSLIPNEQDLADEFGCARATVNRALRAVAESGLIDRKRKAGTRVAINPVRKATLTIPVLREEIESKGKTYSYQVFSSRLAKPPSRILETMKLSAGQELLHHTSLHLADGIPYVMSDRWINLKAVPEIAEVDFTKISANEWLVSRAPFTFGDISFSATIANEKLAARLAVDDGAALFTIDRTTWNGQTAITAVQLIFHDGYKMHTTL